MTAESQLRAKLDEVLKLNEEFQKREGELKQQIVELETNQPDTKLVVKPPRRDLSLQSLVKPWGGEATARPVEEFLDYLEEVAACGAWDDGDRVRICRLKLQGQAATFVRGAEELRGEVTFQRLSEVLKERFGDPNTFEYYGRVLQDMSQQSKEKIQEFADRCITVGGKMARPTLAGDEGTWWAREVERKVLEAFTRGLTGEVGKQVLFGRPQTLKEAQKMALELEQALQEHQRGKNIYVVREPQVEPMTGAQEVQPSVCVCANYRQPGRNEGRVNARPPLSEVQCFNCAKRGHLARNCPNRVGQTPQRTGRRPDYPGACFRCGRIGHFASHCTTAAQNGSDPKA